MCMIKAARFSFDVLKFLIVAHVELLIEAIQQICKEAIRVKFFVLFIFIDSFC